jgi:glutamyl-Q tRNA(Asp) synthetase
MESDEPVLYQSTRADAYERALDALRSSGDPFACACSRRDLEPAGGIHHLPCVADAAAPGAQVAWRMRAPDHEISFVDFACGRQSQNLAREIGDFVLKRADGWHAYQLAVVVDDAAQRITEVVRGADLLDSTPRQIHLQRRLGLPTPAYLHLPLVLDAQGRKLSKQLKSVPVDPADPAPALARALEFLGVDDVARGTPGAMLESAVRAWRSGRYNLERGNTDKNSREEHP